MKVTTRRLNDIIGDIYWDACFEFEFLGDFEIVVDQRVTCYLNGKKPHTELVELVRTRLPIIAEIVIEGGKPTNRYEVTIQPIGLLPRER